MIVVDTSALIAILFREPEAEDFTRLIQAKGRALVPTPAAVEFRIVARAQVGAEGEAEAMNLLRTAPIEIAPFEFEHVDWAMRGFELYGKGRHPAELNFGDCMVYAVARFIGCPLLFKGNDFRKTDIVPAALQFQ